MAFVHSKNARLWVDQYELTLFFNDFTSGGKAGIAETTVYGRGAKTFIGGLKEGTITAKGYFGNDAATDLEDPELTAALGRQNNMAVTLIPNGVTTSGTRCVVAYAAETDLSIMSPVSGVVATSFGAQADSGLSTGIILNVSGSPLETAGVALSATAVVTDASITDNNPPEMTTLGLSATTSGTYIGATGSTTLASILTGYGLHTNNNLSTAGPFPPSGLITIPTANGQAVASYNGITSTGFQNVVVLAYPPAGSSASVLVPYTSPGSDPSVVNPGYITTPALSYGGMVCNLHLLSLSGTTPTTTVQIQHSDDSYSWVQLAEFGGTQVGAGLFSSGTFGSGTVGYPTGAGGAISTVGGYSAVVAYGTAIGKYLRASITGTGSSTPLATMVISLARQ